MNNERGTWTSASSAQADSLCPGRHRAQLAVPETNDGDRDAEFGTRIHKALASGNPDGLDLKERDVYDSCQIIEAKIIGRFFGIELATPPKGIRETRLWIRFSELAHSGQPDVIHRRGIKALVIEYKTLGGEVPLSPRNMQLRDQVCLAYHNSVLIEEIGCVVVQPFSTWEPEICIYTKADIERATAELFERVTASNNPQSPRVAGEVQCKFCRAKSRCVEYQKWATTNLPVARGILETPMADWTGLQLAVVLDNIPQAESWCEQVKMHAKMRLAENPESVPGWKLKENSPIEKINNPQTLFDRFAAIGGKLEGFMQTVNIAKEKLREQVAVVLGTKTRKTVDAKMDELTVGIVDVTPKAPSLAKVKVKEIT